MNTRDKWALLAVLVGVLFGFNVAGLFVEVVDGAAARAIFLAVCIAIQVPALVYTWAKAATV